MSYLEEEKIRAEIAKIRKEMLDIDDTKAREDKKVVLQRKKDKHDLIYKYIILFIGVAGLKTIEPLQRFFQWISS